MELSTPFNSEDTNVVAKRVTKQCSNGTLLYISEDKDVSNSFGHLNAISKDVIDENKLKKIAHGALEDIFLDFIKRDSRSKQ